MKDNFNVMSMKSVSDKLNDLTFTDYFTRLMLLARSIYKWNNLPNGIDEKWIERFLFTEGKCLFFKDKEKGFMVAKCNPGGQVNYYDEYTHLRPYGTNFIGDTLENYEECILIQNNDEMLPTSFTIQLYALRLAEISRAIDVNINAQKTPILITGSDKQMLTLKQLYRKYEGNMPVIFGDKSLDTKELGVLKTDAPIVFDKLQVQKHAIWNEVMTFLGVNNANMEKRERLVDDEVRANNEQIELSSNMFLKSRERACELINKKFGTNISVEVRNIEADEFIEDVSDAQKGGKFE